MKLRTLNQGVRDLLSHKAFDQAVATWHAHNRVAGKCRRCCDVSVCEPQQCGACLTGRLLYISLSHCGMGMDVNHTYARELESWVSTQMAIEQGPVGQAQAV